MIGENFYKAAIEIRKTYLKLINDMESYRNIAESTLKGLNKSMVDIENIKKEMKENRKLKGEGSMSTNILEKVLKVLDGVELEGKKIEEFIDPINRDIEKLAKEEQILYAKICESNPDLSEDQIVDAVRQRLKKEKLL